MSKDEISNNECDVSVIQQKLNAQYKQLGRYKLDLVQKDKVIDDLQELISEKMKCLAKVKQHLSVKTQELEKTKQKLEATNDLLAESKNRLKMIYASYAFKIGTLIVLPYRKMRNIWVKIRSHRHQSNNINITSSKLEKKAAPGRQAGVVNVEINLGDQLKLYYGYHRGGWSYALTQLAQLNTSSGIYLDSFIERTFVWGEGDKSPITKPWVGFMHIPPNVPEWFRSRVSNKSVFATEQWKQSYPYCKGIFTLSNYHKRELEKVLDVPICSLLHPAKMEVIKWSEEAFFQNKNKRIIQVGWWLRKLHAIYELPPSDYKKTFLQANKDPYVLELMEMEKEIEIEKGLFSEEMYETVDLLEYLPDDEYDRMLSENLVFIDLYDSSANNAIIECIARGTPILVNPLEPVKEYLGEDYPFYYESYDEAINKASDYDQVILAHTYLNNSPIKEKLTGEYFRRKLMEAPFLQNEML